MLIANISLALGGNLFIFILLVIAAIGAAILFYRYTLPSLPLRLRIILSALRSLSLVLIILLLFEPMFRSVNRNNEPPTLAVLIDDTQSMTIKDGTGDRVIIKCSREVLSLVGLDIGP